MGRPAAVAAGRWVCTGRSRFASPVGKVLRGFATRDVPLPVVGSQYGDAALGAGQPLTVPRAGRWCDAGGQRERRSNVPTQTARLLLSNEHQAHRAADACTA